MRAHRLPDDLEDDHDSHLGLGDLLLMGRGVQSHYLHAAPKVKGLEQPRINLTFRRLVRRGP